MALTQSSQAPTAPNPYTRSPLRSPRWQSFLNPHPWLSRLGSGVFVEMVKGFGTETASWHTQAAQVHGTSNFSFLRLLTSASLWP